ncbi:MAG TPA: hypothetical protein P5287_02735 [bacterium]|nr:hypothetical protein [bacterium]
MAKNIMCLFAVCVMAALIGGCGVKMKDTDVSNNYVNYHTKQTLTDVHAIALDGEQGEIPKGEEDFSR